MYKKRGMQSCTALQHFFTSFRRFQDKNFLENQTRFSKKPLLKKGRAESPIGQGFLQVNRLKPLILQLFQPIDFPKPFTGKDFSRRVYFSADTAPFGDAIRRMLREVSNHLEQIKKEA